MRVVIVGPGKMGQHHERVLRHLGHDVVTVDQGEQMVKGDWACISTPPSWLVPRTLEALALDMDVLVEKPMASTLKDAAVLRDLDRVTVGYTERFNPALQSARANLPLVGEVRRVRSLRLGPRAQPQLPPALDLLTHDLDTLRFLGYEPEYLHSHSNGLDTMALFSLGTGQAVLQASHSHPLKQRELHILGDEGLLRIYYQVQQALYTDPDGKTYSLPVQRTEPLKQQWRAFPEGATAHDGYLALMHAIAIQEGGYPMALSKMSSAPSRLYGAAAKG